MSRLFLAPALVLALLSACGGAPVPSISFPDTSSPAEDSVTREDSVAPEDSIGADVGAGDPSHSRRRGVDAPPTADVGAWTPLPQQTSGRGRPSHSTRRSLVGGSSGADVGAGDPSHSRRRGR
jgi:hypothetical protein